jgi:nucleoside phosphorylase
MVNMALELQPSIVAVNLVRTFQNVRVGFMVGIGGGVPSREHDIRLGDVVVGSPGSGHPGVFQYDFGKAVQGKAFQFTSCMNLPPKAVRAAITEIRADHELCGNSIRDSINKALDKFPRLRSTCKQPDPRGDRLYQSWVVHDESCCQGLSKEDKSRVISRRARTDDPAIHYGLILSGNQVVKDATIRDRMFREHKALCVEMEAAGLVNTFPCLIIRGICDYADSHKNDEWQGYAAMAAAAFTKDVLARLPVSKIDEEKAIFATLSSG